MKGNPYSYDPTAFYKSLADPRQQYDAPGRRNADGTPAFVRTYRNPKSGRLVGVFADALEVDAKVWQIECADMIEREIKAGERPAPLASWETEPGTVHYAEVIGGPGETTRAKVEAACAFVGEHLRLPFELEVRWFGRVDAARYQKAKHAGQFAQARDKGSELWGLHDEATPERVYLSASLLGDAAILENVAHEGRHAAQCVAWPEAQRRDTARAERDAHAYASQIARNFRLVETPYGFRVSRR